MRSNLDQRTTATARRKLLAFTAAAIAVFAPYPTGAQTIEYLLRPASQIRSLCATCADGEAKSEELQGTFDLTVMPIPEAYTIEAITGIHWHSANFRIVGAGFLERLGRNRISMVVDARVNDQPVLLTSRAHPTESGSSLRLSLMSAPDAPIAIEIDLIAFANTTDGPDADSDGIPDVLDHCPSLPGGRQQDTDLDGIGDPCDECPATLFGDPVLSDGCSVDQSCPCTGPRAGLLWKNQKAYVTCVARGLKLLVETDEISRDQARGMVQAAVNSGCGLPVVASAEP